MPVRAGAAEDAAGARAYFPPAAVRSVIVIGRDDGLRFLRSELAHALRVIDLATRTPEQLGFGRGDPNR